MIAMSIDLYDKAPHDWNDRILSNPDGGNVFQSQELAAQKAASGWTIRYAVAGSLAFTVLEKSVPALGKLWYIPKGPGVKTAAELQKLLPALENLAKQHSVFAVKVEPELPKTDENLTKLATAGLVAVRPIQPNFSTVVIDLSPDLDTIMANLNQKGRHAIRRAERDGVTVEKVTTTDANCQLFYCLLQDTAAGSFIIRPYEYYKVFWQHFSEAKMGQLFFAYFDGQVVAGAFALIYGAKSTYKDGASIRERTAYGASHLLQWHVIQWAKQHGSIVHDLCGAPPSDQINNEQHPYYGIGRFKTSFNKEVTDYVGAYDLVIRPLQYKLWSKIGERLTLRTHFHKYHESWY
jgi:lipid II:glycine glycyltransferase (peptidoglycan interpeptide bridge formation enzyme)